MPVKVRASSSWKNIDTFTRAASAWKANYQLSIWGGGTNILRNTNGL